MKRVKFWGTGLKSVLVIAVLSGVSVGIQSYSQPQTVNAAIQQLSPVYDSGKFTFTVENGEATLTGFSPDIIFPEKQLTIPAKVSSEDGAMAEIPVRRIGSEAFSRRGLTQVDFEDNNVLDNIGSGAFQENRLLTIKLPDSIIQIESNAFSGNKLNKVVLPTALNVIGSYSFANNEITQLNLPSQVREIKSCAFLSNKIEEINLPLSLEIFESAAFNENPLRNIENFRLDTFDIWSGQEAFSCGKLLPINTKREEVRLPVVDVIKFTPNLDVRYKIETFDDIEFDNINKEFIISSEVKSIHASVNVFDRISGNMLGRFYFSQTYAGHFDYSALEAAVKKAQEKLKDKDKYTNESVSKVERELTKGIDILENLAEYEAAVNQQAQWINAAVEYLQLKSDSPSEPETPPSGNNPGGSTETPTPEIKEMSGTAEVMDETRIYRNAETTQATNRTLKIGSKWRVFGVRQVKGNTLAYNLGGNQWIKADDVLIRDDSGQVVQPPEGESVTRLNGIFTVRVPGYPTWSTVLWDNYGKATNRFLKAGTRWKVFAKKQLNGRVYYSLGGHHQWVAAEYGRFSQ
ncbi:leucine-rich repeat domain-containing protein [Lacticaseibacillus saniviri]|uniref:S-layer protein C-terminal domain-containing protein n=2 Tax=Lacticaseibacillus saniviri TaxID=931533 RepID=A0A0R2MTZ2_9LACO|nr:leucine-rich repeat domain-containing protein [Lacticaseibacillus saniviri]KRO16977.1 hypothetical protein IV56_GL000665 [Lacticaseibacillus saniviri JCM 17471 = DSM 24301]